VSSYELRQLEVLIKRRYLF